MHNGTQSRSLIKNDFVTGKKIFPNKTTTTKKKKTERKKERDATDWKMKCSARLIYANILHRYVNECR